MQPGKLSRIHGHPVDLPGAVAVENSKPVDCPQCSNPMGRAFLPGTGGAEAIRCETCQGLWLEGDGLKDVLIAIQKAHGEISVISLGPPTAVVVAPPAPEAPKEVPPPAVTTAPQRAALLDQLRKTRPAPPPQDLEQLPAPALVEGLLREATEAGASDIHIEGTRDQVRVRFRVDGELRAAHLWPKSVHLPLISRLQSLCGVDATEGRFTTQEHDFRVAVVPSQLGPACVIRVLSLSRGIPAVDELGLHPHDLQRVRKVLTHPHGFILATGPTGSGKTTTLFSLLKALGRAKMVTIEDPVDYRLDDVVQVAVDARAGLHFADGLRSLLRLDPDAILVGEIRDQETAQTAVQAALAGRLLLSTLNTQGAAGSITRLLDMGIEPYLVKEVVHCVIGQRLVRLLCPHCRVEHSPSISEMALFGVDPGETVPPIGGAAGRGALEGMQFFKPLGCAQCGQSGYRGRTAVMEVLVNSEAISQAIARRADTREIRQLAMEEGMRSLQQNAFAKYAQGQTSFAEIHQVLG